MFSLFRSASAEDVISDMGAALERLRKVSTRHDDVEEIKKTVIKEDLADMGVDALDEPKIECRDDVPTWQAWARQRALLAGDYKHPRRKCEGATGLGKLQPVPIFCDAEQLTAAIGVTPSLYFDFLKWALAYCVLGAIFSLPSLVTSLIECKHAYPRSELGTAELTSTQVFACASLGGRAACTSDFCKAINLVVPLLEVAYAALLLGGVRKFRQWVYDANEAHEAENILAQEYTVQLHGLPQNARPSHVQAHVQAALKRWLEATISKVEAKGGGGPKRQARLALLQQLQAAQFWRVWGVTLIVNYGTLLRNALEQAPLEKKAVLAHTRLGIELKLQAERNDGWQMSQHIAELQADMRAAAQRLLDVRTTIASRGFAEIKEVCGAFVTFEHQAAARVALALFRPGLLTQCRQPRYARYPIAGPPAATVSAVEAGLTGPALADEMKLDSSVGSRKRRLVALAAPHPKDVQYENLPSRLGALPSMRALNTLGRLVLSRLTIVTALLCSAAAIIVVTTYKNNVADSSGSEEDSATGQALANMAAVVVVVINVLLEKLASALGGFERHEYLSGRRRMLINVLTVSQALNLGFVNLIVSFAASRSILRSIQDEGWMCWHVRDFGGMCDDTDFCCLVGPTGLLLRGTHLTMDAAWQQEVGSLVAYTMVLQLASAIVVPFVPGIQFRCRKRRWRKMLTLVEMTNLFTGPQMELPKFIGKAYAFCFVTLAYGGVMPVLYLNGILFFGATWLVHRYAILRFHQTPPAYAPSLVLDTLWWLEVAVFFHLFFATWAYANVPSDAYDSDGWTPPFPNASAYHTYFFVDGGAASASQIHEHYNIRGHINSPGTLLLGGATLVILAKIGIDVTLHVLSFVVPVPRDSRALWKTLTHRARLARRLLSASVAPQPEESPDSADADLALADSLEVDGDPPFSQALRGAKLSKVRSYKGGIVHETNVSHSKATLLDCLAYVNPLKTLFAAIGLQRDKVRLTPEQWATEAVPVQAQIIGSANMSYEPEYSPTYSKAYEYMAPTYVLNEAVKLPVKKVEKPKAAEAAEENGTEQADEYDDDDEYDSDEDEYLTLEARYYLEKQQRSGAK